MTPLAAQYSLELDIIKGEIQSFYNAEDPSKLSFPSLPNLPKPKNVDEYLEMKAKQVDMITKEKCKGKDDRTTQGINSN